MLALILLVSIFIIVVICITRKLPQKLRRIYLISIACDLIFGSMSSIIYTIDNSLYNQDDMPGDSQYYFDGAMYYISLVLDKLTNFIRPISNILLCSYSLGQSGECLLNVRSGPAE
jgi:hypothetical protein